MRGVSWLLLAVVVAACKGGSPEEPIADAGTEPGATCSPSEPPTEVGPCKVLGLPGAPSIPVAADLVRLGDVDGDGKLDLVAIRGPSISSDSSIRVSLGHCDTTFGASIESALADPQLADVSAAELADLDGDGSLDLVLAAQGRGILILLGDGTGRFTRTFYRPTGRIFGIAVADLNRDHKPDLVLASPAGFLDDPDLVRVRLGNGDGSFGDESTYLVGQNPTAVTVADIDGDRIPDVIVANVSDANLSLLLGKGDGTFRDKRDVDTVKSPSAIASADLNRDGKIDLVIAGLPEGVSVLLNEGGGTFRPYTPTLPRAGYNTSTWGVAVGDLNRDGKLDVIANVSGAVLTFTGNGDGTLQEGTLVGGADGSPLVGDVSGDGALDVVMAFLSDVFVLQSDGSGGFVSPIRHATGRSATAVATADFNGDGNADLALFDTSSPSPSVSIALGNGDGGFRDLVDDPLPSNLRGAVRAQDVTGDGIVDLMAGLSVLPGNGDGTFREAVAPALFNGTVFELGDINGDDKPDLVGAVSDTVALFAGNGDGTFQAGQLLWQVPKNSGIASLAVGNINGDGRQDIVVSHALDCIETCTPVGRDGLQVLLNEGGGTFHASFETASFEGPVAIADLDGDGKLDVVTGTRVWLGNGDGTLQPPRTYGGDGYGDLRILDITGDGKLDIVQGGDVVPGNGDGTFGPPLLYAGLGSASAIVDVNRDGRLDVITAGNDPNPSGTTFHVGLARCVR